DPNEARALAAIGHLRRRQGDRSGSLSAFQKAASLEPNNVFLQLELAVDLGSLSRLPEARNLLQSQQQKHPDRPEVLVALAHLDRRSGNHTSALENFQAAASMVPDNIPLQLEIINEMQELGRIESVTELVTKLLE